MSTRMCFLTRSRWALFAFAVFALLCLTPRLFLGALRHWDEAWYAQVSREMLATGDWLSLHWNYQLWFHKPPLAFWATSLNFTLFGVSEVTARFFSFLCGLACVGVVTLFVRSELNQTTALTAGLFLIAIPAFARYSTQGQLDAPISLWITLHLCTFWRGLDRPTLHWWSGLWFGLSLMTKGAAAGLALVVQIGYVLVSKDYRCLGQRSWWLSFVIGGLIALPWHLHQIWTHGETFASAYFSRHLTQFFVSIYPEVNDTPASPWHYLEHLLERQIPMGWLILLLIIAGGFAALRSKRRLDLFAWMWVASMLVGLSLARTKWTWYLMPMYPGTAVLLAVLTCRLSPRRQLFGIATMSMAALLTALSVLWVPVNKEHEQSLKALSPLVKKEVPLQIPVSTVQVGRASKSVYPIAALYYCERPMRAVHGLEHFDAVCSKSAAVFYALIHEAHLPTLFEQSRGRYVLELTGQEGEVCFVRVVPGYIAEEIYGSIKAH